jgi:hypothetical protein
MLQDPAAVFVVALWCTVLLTPRLVDGKPFFPVRVTTVAPAMGTYIIDAAPDSAGNIIYVSGGACRVYRMSFQTGASEIIAGGLSCGAANGVGTAAYFNDLYGISIDTSVDVAYISENDNCRVRRMDLTTKVVTTLAGGAQGYRNGIGTAAQFNFPTGLVFHASGVIYLVDNGNGVVRKIVVATAVVSTVATVGGCPRITVTRDGSTLYLSTYANTIQRVTAATGAVVTLAGSATAGNVNVDGVGTATARFNQPSGVELNSDETALIIGQVCRVRWLDLTTLQVTTIAGGSCALQDGRGRSAGVRWLLGGKRYCNTTTVLCGMITPDCQSATPGSQCSIRFTSIGVITGSASPTWERSASGSPSVSADASHTATPSASMPTSKTLTSKATRTATKKITESGSPNVSADPSHTATPSASMPTSKTLTSKATRTATNKITESGSPSVSADPSHTATPSASMPTSKTLTSKATPTATNKISESGSPSESAATSRSDMSHYTTETRTLSQASATQTMVATMTMMATLTLSDLALSASTTSVQSRTHSPTVTLNWNTYSRILSSSVSRGAMTVTYPNLSPTVTEELSVTTTRSPTISWWSCDVNVSETFLSLSPLNNLAAGLLDTTGGVFAMVTANVAGLMRAGLGGGGLPTVVISARPIPRVMLLSMPRLAFNISVAAPSTAARWTVVNVTSSGELVQWSASTTNTVPWIRLVVTSPSDGWIGLSTPLLTPRTIGLQLYLSCDGTSVLSTQLSIPAPELPRLYAELVDVSLRYSQIVSVIVGGASSGSALGRVFATRNLVMCRVETAVGVGVADFELSVCDDNEEGISNVARSAITSNAVAVAIVGAALCLLSVAWKVLSSTRSVTLLEGAYRMCLPSSVLSVWVLVAPSTTAAWTFLLSDLSTSTCLTTDVFLALCGMMMSISPILALTALWFFWARPSATATLLCTFESPPTFNMPCIGAGGGDSRCRTKIIIMAPP